MMCIDGKLVRRKRDFVTQVNCVLGMLWGMWHPIPTWAMIGGGVIALMIFATLWAWEYSQCA